MPPWKQRVPVSTVEGFAVVAEEVRNLAQRSAVAAKETTVLIESNLSSVNTGSEIAGQTDTALAQIVEGIAKVADLAKEIADASSDQATGVGQVNESLTQIEQVTQSNTSNAEESAAASEELSSQAQHLNEVIRQFKLTKDNTAGGQARLSAPKASAPRQEQRQLASAPNANSQVKPEDIINLDDDDFAYYSEYRKYCRIHSRRNTEVIAEMSSPAQAGIYSLRITG